MQDICTTTYLFNFLNAELNPICHLLALLGAHPILQVSRISVKASAVEKGFSPPPEGRGRGGQPSKGGVAKNLYNK